MKQRKETAAELRESRDSLRKENHALSTALRCSLSVPAETPFGPCIDWDADVPWTPVSRATPLVKMRIERSRKRHGRRFLTQHTSDHFGVPLDEPIRTITTKDQWAIVDGDRYRPITVRETARGMSFPDSYRWPEGSTRRDQITGLGNAVPPKQAAKVIAATIAVAFPAAVAA